MRSVELNVVLLVALAITLFVVMRALAYPMPGLSSVALATALTLVINLVFPPIAPWRHAR